MKSFLALVFTLLFVYCVCEKEQSNITQVQINKYGMIQGTVRDSINESFIDSARIIIEPVNEVVYTDSLGQYYFPKLAPDKYKISASKFGYTISNKHIDVFPNDTTIVNLYLSSLEKYNFNVSEGFIPLDTICQPFIIIYIKTERIFGSSDCKIIHNINHDQNNINIDLLGIQGGCNTAMGPATARIILDINHGDYKLLSITYFYINFIQASCLKN